MFKKDRYDIIKILQFDKNKRLEIGIEGLKRATMLILNTLALRIQISRRFPREIFLGKWRCLLTF